jgi:hypothetical protein
MMAIFVTIVTAMLFLGPVLWRVRLDQRRAEADVVGAEIRAAANRRLRGESFLSVHVTAPALWRAGRIVLSVPSGHESLVETAWPAIVSRVPAGYELVLGASEARPAVAPNAADARILRRAA